MRHKLFATLQYKLYSVIGLLSVIALTLVINQKYNLSLLATIGAFSAIVLIVAFLLILLRNQIETPVKDWNEKVRRAQTIAKSKKHNPYTFGKKDQHIVWHANKKKARVFYDNVIVPLTEKNRRKKYYFITKDFNNISNGKSK